MCTGRYVCLEFHDDATDLRAADHHVEEDLGIGRIDFERRRVAALDRPCGQLGAGEGIAHVVACVCDGGRGARSEMCLPCTDNQLGLPPQRF